MRTITRIRAVAAGLTSAVLALGLAACTPDDDPTDPPTTETAETVSSDDPPTTGESTEPTEPATTREPPDIDPPTPPVEMGQDDVNGAAAATDYFLQLYGYMRATGETTEWDAMTQDCEWCEGTRDGVVSLYASGGWIDGQGLTYDISDVRIEYPRDEQPFYVARLPAIEEPFTQVDASGTTMQSDGSAFDPIIVGVQYQAGGGYKVLAVEYAES